MPRSTSSPKNLEELEPELLEEVAVGLRLEDLLKLSCCSQRLSTLCSTLSLWQRFAQLRGYADPEKEIESAKEWKWICKALNPVSVAHLSHFSARKVAEAVLSNAQIRNITKEGFKCVVAEMNFSHISESNSADSSTASFELFGDQWEVLMELDNVDQIQWDDDHFTERRHSSIFLTRIQPGPLAQAAALPAPQPRSPAALGADRSAERNTAAGHPAPSNQHLANAESHGSQVRRSVVQFQTAHHEIHEAEEMDLDTEDESEMSVAGAGPGLGVLKDVPMRVERQQWYYILQSRQFIMTDKELAMVDAAFDLTSYELGQVPHSILKERSLQLGFLDCYTKARMRMLPDPIECGDGLEIGCTDAPAVLESGGCVPVGGGEAGRPFLLILLVKCLYSHHHPPKPQPQKVVHLL